MCIMRKHKNTHTHIETVFPFVLCDPRAQPESDQWAFCVRGISSAGKVTRRINKHDSFNKSSNLAKQYNSRSFVTGLRLC